MKERGLLCQFKLNRIGLTTNAYLLFNKYLSHFATLIYSLINSTKQVT